MMDAMSERGVRDTIDRRDRIAGVLLGTAVGDALGLPREGLAAGRAARIFGGPPLRHRFALGRGMISDDTEHACMVAQAFLASDGEPRRFARSLARRLRFWLLGLPAGVGMATAKGILRSWIGFPPHRSGVRSQGNGPAMRCGLLGLLAKGDHVRDLVEASTRITHRDPVAEEGALVIALACGYAAERVPEEIDAAELLGMLRAAVSEPAMRDAIEECARAVESGFDGERWRDRHGRGRGVSGWVLETVPAALLCWLRHPRDFRAAVTEVILLGGDADTTGAIAGALAGASVGASGIPRDLLDGIAEWPRSLAWMRRLAARVAAGETRPLPLFWPALLPRNLLFLVLVLGHGFRRLLPPYGGG